MNDTFTFSPGTSPLLISVPHAGLRLTPAVEDGLVEAALTLPDTDWHIPRLYDFASGLGASLLVGQYSRFVIDLNRPDDDQPLYAGATTGLYPDTLFDGTPLFKPGQAPSGHERTRYLEDIWRPYHRKIADELARLRGIHGYALLWDAHSICSHVPRLFDGTLPDFNLGTFNNASCAPALAARLEQVCAQAQGYSHVLNGRFKGGHITRHYGAPADGIHAVQLELGQATYMNEQPPFDYLPDVAEPTRGVLRQLLEAALGWAAERHRRV
jgi:N-formylglutamate deformylase